MILSSVKSIYRLLVSFYGLASRISGLLDAHGIYMFLVGSKRLVLVINKLNSL